MLNRKEAVGKFIMKERDFIKGNYLDGGLREREEQEKNSVCVIFIYPLVDRLVCGRFFVSEMPCLE